MPKIDITPLKKIAHELDSEIVKDLISCQPSRMDLDDLLANFTAWERQLKKEAKK